MKHAHDLDAIIGRYATPDPSATRPQFRPFTQEDWQAFNGCETATPKIFEGEALIVVLDGSAVFVLDIEEGEHEGFVARSAEEAEQVAAPIAAADDFDTARELIFAREIMRRGFELAGTFYRLRVGHSHEIVARAKGEDRIPHSWRETVLSARPIGDEIVLDWSAGSREGFDSGLGELRAAIEEVEADT